jgi:hypothetical protein
MMMRVILVGTENASGAEKRDFRSVARGAYKWNASWSCINQSCVKTAEIEARN